ncbi:cadherin-17 [Lates calcarifer]|uniref:Cadherin-17 n=1 Tax=Lates calcarifer TaxID=8187 RepID=A0A4W6CI17_LATCA|nr:cadherin-17 [Lates calcarifer]
MGLLRSLSSLRSDSLDLSAKTVIMTPMVHLLLLPLLFSIAGGKDLEEKKGPFENTMLDVPEGTPVPYPMHQFQVTHPGVNNFRLSGEGREKIKISRDGWLYLEKSLDWSQEEHYTIMVEALADDEVVEGPISVIINVLDVNNNAPYFNQTDYTAVVRENKAAGVPFTRVFALDQDDPKTPNARLSYSLVSQIPNKQHTLLFQINPNTGEISTTEEGERMLKAREGIKYGRGEDQSIETLKTKFDEYCPGNNPQSIPYEANPFFTCVERAEMRRRNADPLEDPDYTLIVRVQDLGGESENALSGNARVHIVVQQNLWFSPGPIIVKENLLGNYPMVIAKVQSNDPDAIYSLVQKERELKFPFQITEDGEILLTEPLDREDKNMYILVVFAKDNNDQELEEPLEIQVIVGDVNDNAPMCEKEESVFEVQENEPVGSLVGKLLAHDIDDAETLNAQLTYTILSQNPPTTPIVFSIDAASGEIRALRSLQRKEEQAYHLSVKVSDPAFSTDCKVIIKVIDINNELPLFEKTDYGNHTLAEDTTVGHTLLTITATDADDPDSGSSLIEFHISSGNDGNVFAVETDGKGVGHLVIAKPLDYESSKDYKLQIDARNPEPLMKNLEYGRESTAFVSVSVTDVDEAPEFSLDILDVTVPENTTKGSVLLTVEAKDPEGKEIGFKLDGDTRGWLEIDAATGEIKTKDNLDRETLETFEVTVTAFEKENPEKSSERVVSVRLLDVNDNIPRLIEKQAFICVKKPEPVIIKAQDGDSEPFSKPFTFTFAHGKKTPNWDLKPIDDTAAILTLKKIPTEDKTFTLPINIKDKAGMGVTQSFEVRVCNCTELGYCYVAPADRSSRLGMGPTIGILAGTLGFCVVVFIVVIKRVNKGGKRKTLTEEEERERNVMM